MENPIHFAMKQAKWQAKLRAGAVLIWGTTYFTHPLLSNRTDAPKPLLATHDENNSPPDSGGVARRAPGWLSPEGQKYQVAISTTPYPLLN
jgi:hypothetical protein